MAPYRTPPEPAAVAARDAPPEERALAIALVAIGALRVVAALIAHQTFGAETTIALAMIVVGLRK